MVRETAARMAERLQIPVLGTPEYWLAHDIGYLGDHAGVGETSLLWHLHPDLVAIDRIAGDPAYVQDDRIATQSSPELGRQYAELISDRLAQLARAMPTWNAETLAAFIAAERALVSAQVKGWRTDTAWSAWQALKEHTGYGRSLVEEDFDGIVALAEHLGDAAKSSRK